METLTYSAPRSAITQPFGKDNTNHPVRKSFYKLFDNKHPGVDFKLKIGTPIKSAYSGVVVRREFHQGMGKVVGVRNGNIVCLYAHLSKFEIKLGQVIKNAQLIGLSGDTGKACLSPHLHFEMRDITKPSLKIVEKERDQLVHKLDKKDSESKLLETSLRKEYENELKSKEEMIEYYKDLKAKLSTKMLAETLHFD